MERDEVVEYVRREDSDEEAEFDQVGGRSYKVYIKPKPFQVR